MEQSLRQSTCVPCRGGEPPLTEDEIEALRPAVPAWQVTRADGVTRIERAFSFPDFKSAMAFAVRVGELAEQQDHHPDLYVAWGRVRVEFWTHKIGGLHKNDFVMASKVDELLEP